MAIVLPIHEWLYLVTSRHEGRGCNSHVSRLNPMVPCKSGKYRTADETSVAGGCLMAFVGLLYLVFEDYVLAEFTSPKRSSAALELARARAIAGIQIGLIILSTWVTRSSALSMQAKLGLPRGNQVVGWIVMGKMIPPKTP